VERSQPDLPERRLWCNVIGLHVQAALRNDHRSYYWITNSNGGFVELAELLDLHPETVKRIQQAIIDRTAKKQTRHKNQYTKARAANPVKLPDPAPLCHALTSAAPFDGPNHARLPLQVPSAVCVPSDGWIGSLELISVPVPKFTRKRKGRNPNNAHSAEPETNETFPATAANGTL
jgi:hypothetical protein